MGSLSPHLSQHPNFTSARHLTHTPYQGRGLAADRLTRQFVKQSQCRHPIQGSSCAYHQPTTVCGSSALGVVAVSAASVSSMGLGALFVASLLPVLKVAMLCSTGAVMAMQGLLSHEGRRAISSLVFNLFVPCLFLDKLGSGVGFQKAVELWPLMFNLIASHALGALLGVALVIVVRAPKRIAKHIVLCCMLSNSGNLPIVLVDSLGKDPALAALGGAALGVQYIILSNFAGTFIQFPPAIMLLRPPADKPNESDMEPIAAPAASTVELQQVKQQQHDGVASDAEFTPYSTTTPRHSNPIVGGASATATPTTLTQQQQGHSDASFAPILSTAHDNASAVWDTQPLLNGDAMANGNSVAAEPQGSFPADGSGIMDADAAPVRRLDQQGVQGSVGEGTADSGGPGQSVSLAAIQHPQGTKNTGQSSADTGQSVSLAAAQDLQGTGNSLQGTGDSSQGAGNSCTAASDAEPLIQTPSSTVPSPGLVLTATQHQRISTERSAVDSGTGPAVTATQQRRISTEIEPAPLPSSDTYPLLKQGHNSSDAAAATQPARSLRVTIPATNTVTVSAKKHHLHGLKGVLAARWASAQPIVSSIVSPPTVASVIALAVASVPPVQALFFSPTGPLRLLGEVVNAFGNMAIPCLMLVLGANLSRGPGVATIPLRCIVGTVVLRLVIMPIAGTGLVVGMRSAGMLKAVEPIGIVVMLIQHAMPTAIMVHSIATMYNNQPDDVAALLFWEYLASALTLPFVMAAFLKLVTA